MKINTMNKRVNLSLVSLLTISGFILISQTSKAEDVCSPVGLNQELANQTCPDICKKSGDNWYGKWLGKTSKKCPIPNKKITNPNIYGSICACVPYKCANVQIRYKKSLPSFYVTMDYETCQNGAKKGDTALPPGDNFLARVGTAVDIGPKWLKTVYTHAIVPEEGLKVVCSGVWGSTGNCKLVTPSLPMPDEPLKPSPK